MKFQTVDVFLGNASVFKVANGVWVYDIIKVEISCEDIDNRQPFFAGMREKKL